MATASNQDQLNEVVNLLIQEVSAERLKYTDLAKALMALDNIARGESLGLAAGADTLDQIGVGDPGTVLSSLGIPGVGSTGAQDWPYSSLDAVDVTNLKIGEYRAGSSVSGAPPGFSSNFTVSVRKFSSSSAILVARDFSNPTKSAMKYITSGVSRSWILDINTSSLVGIVSQAGGVSNGAAFERGSNSFGFYEKTAGGSVDMWGTIPLALASSNRLEYDGPLPVDFIYNPDSSIPMVMPDQNTGSWSDSSQRYRGQPQGRINSDKNLYVTMYKFDFADWPANLTGKAFYQVKARWY